MLSCHRAAAQFSASEPPHGLPDQVRQRPIGSGAIRNRVVRRADRTDISSIKLSNNAKLSNNP
jgi:hypothetical protein